MDLGRYGGANHVDVKSRVIFGLRIFRNHVRGADLKKTPIPEDIALSTLKAYHADRIRIVGNSKGVR